jgi:PKD repeat protein
LRYGDRVDRLHDREHAPCTYATAGTFTASVRVTGGTAIGSATTSVTVTAAPVASYTVALAASPATIAAGGSTTLTATITRVNGAPPPTSWSWDCDTNTPSTDFTSAITATCTYPTTGIFIAKVTATNGSITGSATVDVNVTAAVAPTPVVTVHCAQPVPPALTVNCNVTATLNGATVGSGGIVAANWDFGDQVPTTSLTNASTHTYAAPNTYTVLVTNVSVPGTTVKGTGFVSVSVQ